MTLQVLYVFHHNGLTHQFNKHLGIFSKKARKYSTIKIDAKLI